MITYLKFQHSGERFWAIKIDEDTKYIYAIVKNEMLDTRFFNYGDIIKIDKETKTISLGDDNVSKEYIV